MTKPCGALNLTWLPLVLLMSWLSPANAAETQSGLNRTACAELAQTERQLSRLLSEILGNHAKDKVFITRMKASQRAWVAYRKAYVESLYPHMEPSEYGSVLPMCQCNALSELTFNRIKDLEQWTVGIEMGDVCTGSRATRP